MQNRFAAKGFERILNEAPCKSNAVCSEVIIHGRSGSNVPLIQFKFELNLTAHASVCQIRAADSGEPQRSHQTRVSVQVVEVPKESENPPVFKTNNQTVEVTESDEVGFLVALVQAADKDGDSLWYDIVGEFYYFTLLLRKIVISYCIQGIKLDRIK